MRVGIVGYGNLGRGVEAAVRQNEDMELVGVFTGRNPEEIKLETDNVRVYSVNELENFQNGIDVVVLCGGSATDLPEKTPLVAGKFNVVDSFDTHAKIPEHFEKVDSEAKKGKKAALISVGWDPGIFSLNRLYARSILPEGKDYTFWGRGVSQGHSDAIRRIEGVMDARQYTVPVDIALEKVRSGENPDLNVREKHTRECFVVASDGADLSKIEAEIKNMPNYFDEYDTTVNFISMEEMKKNHSEIPHGGFVIRTGKTGFNKDKSHIIEYSLKLDSNPEFTASVLVAYARACYRLFKEGKTGAMTVFDVPPVYLSPFSGEELRASVL